MSPIEAPTRRRAGHGLRSHAAGSDTPGRRERAPAPPARAVAALAIVLVLVLVVVFGVSPVAAQVSFVDDAPPRYEWRGRVGLDYHHQFESETDRGDEFDHWRLAVAGDLAGPINESILLGFRAGYAHESWDVNLDNGAPATFGGTGLPREPWNTINTVDLRPSATVLVGSAVSVEAGVPIRWAGESGSDANGFVAGVSALVRWQINDSVALGAGIGVTSQLEDDAETFPLVSLDWRIDESLRLRTEGSWMQGGRALLLWGPSESIRLRLVAGYERTRFRLDDNGNAADRNGIGEVTQVPIEVGLRLRFTDSAWLDVHGGLAFAGRVRVESRTGRKLYDQAFEPAPRVGFRIVVPLAPFASAASAASARPAAAAEPVGPIRR